MNHKRSSQIVYVRANKLLQKQYSDVRDYFRETLSYAINKPESTCAHQENNCTRKKVAAYIIGNSTPLKLATLETIIDALDVGEYSGCPGDDASARLSKLLCRYRPIVSGLQDDMPLIIRRKIFAIGRGAARMRKVGYYFDDELRLIFNRRYASDEDFTKNHDGDMGILLLNILDEIQS